MAANTTSDELPNEYILREITMTLRSGRIIQSWRIEQKARRQHFEDNIGHSIQFDFINPMEARSRPMSEVFNTPELLEQILLGLKTGFILSKAQSACSGFKQSIDASPSFRKRRTFAFRIESDIDENGLLRSLPSFHVNLKLRSIHELRASPGSPRANFLLERGLDYPAFRELAAMEGLRRLRLFDKAVPRVFIRWRTCQVEDRIILRLKRRHGSGFTFGHVFDAVTEGAGGKKVLDLEILWFRVSGSEIDLGSIYGQRIWRLMLARGPGLRFSVPNWMGST
jgi:hypothetical protein